MGHDAQGRVIGDEPDALVAGALQVSLLSLLLSPPSCPYPPLSPFSLPLSSSPLPLHHFSCPLEPYSFPDPPSHLTPSHLFPFSLSLPSPSFFSQTSNHAFCVGWKPDAKWAKSFKLVHTPVSDITPGQGLCDALHNPPQAIQGLCKAALVDLIPPRPSSHVPVPSRTSLSLIFCNLF